MQPFTAQLDSWEISILDISDSLQHSIVRHEYIGADGADLESVGARPRTVSFRTYWFGDEGRSATPYLKHYEFVNFLSNGQNIHTLIHPKYGTLNGYVDSFGIFNNDTQDYVEVDIQFTENKIFNQTIFPSSGQIDLDSAYIKQLNETIDGGSSWLKDNGYSSLLTKQVNTLQTLSQQIQGINVATRKFISSIDDNIKIVNNFFSTVSLTANSIDTAVSYAGDIPSLIVGSVHNACNRLIGSFYNIRNLPVAFANNFTSSFQSLYNSFTGTAAGTFRIAARHVAAGTILWESTANFVTDQNNANQQATKAFDINGNSKLLIVLPNLMSRTDVESLMFTLQNFTQEAVLLQRNCPALKKMMADLNNYINFTKLSRLSVKEIVVNNMPLHILLMQLGKSYEEDNRFLALNPAMHNPTFCQGAVKIYA